MSKTTNMASGALSGAASGATIGGPWGAAIGAVAGGLLGGSGGDNQANDYYKEMQSRLAQINVPGADQLQFTPEEIQNMGNYTPEQLQQFVLQKSAMEGVAVDPRIKQDQMKALDRVSQLADKGFSDEDMMAFNVARQQAAGEAQAKQGQILQNMQARGQGGSGNELIARLQSSQDSANQLSLEQQKQAIAQAQARKEALGMLSNQSNSMRSQDFGEQSQIASAKDVVNKYNAQNAQNVAGTNVANNNLAQQSNLANAQNIQNQNVGIRNQGKANNAAQLINKYNMDFGKATGQNQTSNQQAQFANGQAANNSAGIGQIGQGLVQLSSTNGFKNLFAKDPAKVESEDYQALGDLTKDEPANVMPRQSSGKGLASY